MPFWLSPSGLWSSPTATSTTTGSHYTWLGSGTSATATISSLTRTVVWYNNAYIDSANAQTVAWSNRPSLGNYWGLANDPQEAMVLHMLESQTRQQPIRSPAIIRRRSEVAQRYEREMAERAAAEQLERQHAGLQAHSDAAKKRALDLLLEHLTPAQRETFHKNSWFIVEGRSSRRYRINARGSLAGNVDVLDGAMKTIHRLCAHCDIHTIPLGDQLLAQKLMLEFDEDAFLRIANRHAA